MNMYVLILLCSVIIASISQVLLKKSAMKQYSSWIKEYLNVYVIVGYLMMFVSLFMTMIAYRGFENFATVALFESLGYIFVLILGYFIFKEKISIKKLVGMAFIIFGIFIYNMV